MIKKEGQNVSVVDRSDHCAVYVFCPVKAAVLSQGLVPITQEIALL